MGPISVYQDSINTRIYHPSGLYGETYTLPSVSLNLSVDPFILATMSTYASSHPLTAIWTSVPNRGVPQESDRRRPPAFRMLAPPPSSVSGASLNLPLSVANSRRISPPRLQDCHNLCSDRWDSQTRLLSPVLWIPGSKVSAAASRRSERILLPRSFS